MTALAVLQLDALPKKARTKAVKRAIADAATWLKKKQKKNGSLGGGTATEASNTNSTGLAAWALGETGSCKKARAAARWVRDLQVSGDVSGTPLAGEKGAIAYDRAAYRSAAADGIDERGPGPVAARDDPGRARSASPHVRLTMTLAHSARLAAATVLVAAAGTLLPAAPAAAATCSSATGVSVVVDGSGLGGGIVTSCVSRRRRVTPPGRSSRCTTT